jgi:hypothetical protein
VLLVNGLKGTFFSNWIGINKKVVADQFRFGFGRWPISFKALKQALPLCHHLKIKTLKFIRYVVH